MSKPKVVMQLEYRVNFTKLYINLPSSKFQLKSELIVAF